ncbi:MAG: ABC transporter permease [Dongiaceae bacterium]
MRDGPLARLAWGAVGVLGLVFLVSPLLLVVFFSFAVNRHATLPVGGLTLAWYGALLGSANFLSALRNSLIVTLSVGLLSTVVGTLAAFALARMRPRTVGWLSTLLSMPVMLPPLVLALALATLYAALGFRLGLYSVIPSHLVFTQPFVILVVYAQMAAFSDAVIDSARDLGATRTRTFLTVVLPMIRPTLIGATLVAMSVSLDDFVITFFTIGGGLTLSTLVWGMLRTSLDPSVNALGTLILAATVGASVVALRLTRYHG